jgi:molybdate transport system substrate-binding protein
MTRLNILSGGAAQESVARFAPSFKAETGFDIAGEFGVVGAMVERLGDGVSESPF